MLSVRNVIVFGAALTGIWSCSGERATPSSQRSTEEVAQTEAPKGARTAPEPAPVATEDADPVAPEPAPEPAPAEPESEPADTGTASAGHDFIEEVAMLYRVVACAGDGPVPGHLDRGAVAAYCTKLERRKDRYRERYVDGAREFIARLRPDGLPQVVVYPFGGGDLISALVAFPDAVEITTLSLEHAGDPRRIRDLDEEQLGASLEALTLELGGMLAVSNNTSKNLSEAHTNLLPAQLSSFLIALAVHGYEPASVRYFTLEDDGDIHYLSQAEIAELDDERARKLKHDWTTPNFSTAFSNVELAFRPAGASADAPLRIHRHIAANLADGHLKDNPAVLAHLRAKGKVAAMTKAASYLLWRRQFSRVRDYLLDNMAWMLSDSTGIPPAYAEKAGMKQITYGTFTGSYLEADEDHNQAFRELWESQPRRRLPFRFGYVDAEKHPHLLITAPAGR